MHLPLSRLRVTCFPSLGLNPGVSFAPSSCSLALPSINMPHTWRSPGSGKNRKSRRSEGTRIVRLFLEAPLLANFLYQRPVSQSPTSLKVLMLCPPLLFSIPHCHFPLDYEPVPLCGIDTGPSDPQRLCLESRQEDGERSSEFGSKSSTPRLELHVIDFAFSALTSWRSAESGLSTPQTAPFGVQARCFACA